MDSNKQLCEYACDFANNSGNIAKLFAGQNTSYIAKMKKEGKKRKTSKNYFIGKHAVLICSNAFIILLVIF